MLEAWFDGCCEPMNPGGHAAYGAVLCRDGVKIWEKAGYCGFGRQMSNNVAEYSGVLAVLRQLKYETEPCLIRGDSKLVIYHLVPDPRIGRKWQVNGGLYMPIYRNVKPLYDSMKHRVGLEWIPREENAICDVLSKGVLKARGVTFRIQPEAA